MGKMMAVVFDGEDLNPKPHLIRSRACPGNRKTRKIKEDESRKEFGRERAIEREKEKIGSQGRCMDGERN